MTESKKSTSFEEQLNQLQQIVNQLQTGELSLADSMNKFKEGMTLSHQLQQQLDSAQKTLAQLMDDQGNLQPAEKAGEDLSNNGVANQGYKSEFQNDDDSDSHANMPF